MRKRYQVTHGIVIRRSALPSGDVVVTLLSPHGKWRAVARKGKLPGGNLGRLSLFHDVTVQYYRKQEEDLALLTQVRLDGALQELASPAVYEYAHMLTELADALTVDVHVGEPFHGYLASALRGLCRDPDPERVALVYAWKLLQLAGLAPRAARCANCGTTAGLAFLDVAGGALTCDACRAGVPLGRDAAAELQRVVLGTVREGIALPLADRTLHWRTLRTYLAYHVRQLHSLTIMPAWSQGSERDGPDQPGAPRV